MRGFLQPTTIIITFVLLGGFLYGWLTAFLVAAILLLAAMALEAIDNKRC